MEHDEFVNLEIATTQKCPIFCIDAYCLSLKIFCSLRYFSLSFPIWVALEMASNPHD